jgi:hypothetical protein
MQDMTLPRWRLPSTESKHERRHRLLQAEVLEFARKYARTAPRGGEPNDRTYKRKTEAWVKRLPPEQLDELLNGE